MINYCFSYEYNKDFFLKPQDIANKDIEHVYSDFVTNLTRLLNDSFQIKTSTSKSIAECLWHRMSDGSLYYHTPVHVLSMLQDFQKLNSTGDYLKLSHHWRYKTYHLAIWFHDAIYVVGAEKGENEDQSADFMSSLVKPFMDMNDLFDARGIIKATASFDDLNMNEIFDIIMDLDILNFAWNFDNYEQASNCVKAEFQDIPDYESKRKKFLQSVLDRKFIYRNSAIRNSFELKARKNLEKSIAKTN